MADLYWDNVVLALPCDGANGSTTFTDISDSPKTVTKYGNAQISTARCKFGGASAYFDGSGDYLTVPHSSDFDLRSGDFTIEFWFYPITRGSRLISKRSIGTNATWFVDVLTASGQPRLIVFGSSTVVVEGPVVNFGAWHHIAICRQGNTYRIYADGVSGSAVESSVLPGISTNPLAIGLDPAYPESDPTIGYIDDLRITKGVARYTTDFIPPTVSYFDDLGVYTPVSAALIGQYADAPGLSAAIIGQYSLIMEQAIIGRYGDAARLLAGLVGRYGNTLLVKSALVGRYGDLVQVAAALEGFYHLMHARTAALVGEYALCGIELLAALVGRYDLRERDEIMAALEGYYSLLPGSTIEQILCPVLIGGVLVNWAAVSWTLSEESYLIEATITLRDQAQWRAIAKQDNVTITWHGTTYTLFVATKLRSRSVSGSPGAAQYGADYVVVARSLTNGLDAPYALPTTMAWPVDTMASAIALDLIGSLSDIITLEWQLEDWMQPGGTFFVTDQTPLEGLRALAAIIGGIVQTGPGNSLILRRADVVPPTQWASSLPAWTIEDSGIFSDSESEEQSNLYNVITVTNQSETAETVNFEIEDLSDYRKRVKGYRTPWVDFGLATSGGSWVTIVDDGVVEAEITETVEFVDGSASASKPIYSPVSVTWKQVSLGAVTGSEDGSLIAAIAGCSLAEITYTTKYHAWIGSSDRDETVQFYQVEL